MNILVFDTSTDLLAVAVKNAEGEHFFHSSRGFRHSETLLPAIERCLNEASLTLKDIGLIACASGPGSFTGLRIGMATAKGLSLALGIPWVGVPTLDGIALTREKAGRTIVPVIDARKNRLYSALYKDGHRLTEYLDISLSELLALVDGEAEVDFVGPDADLMADYALERPGFSVIGDDPETGLRALASLGEAIYREKGPALEEEGPLYMREPDVGHKPVAGLTVP